MFLMFRSQMGRKGLSRQLRTYPDQLSPAQSRLFYVASALSGPPPKNLLVTRFKRWFYGLPPFFLLVPPLLKSPRDFSSVLPVLLTALLVATLLCYYRTCSPSITLDIACITCTPRLA